MTARLDGKTLGSPIVSLPGQDRNYLKPRNNGIGRKCAVCMKIMTKYNRGHYCYSCRDKIDKEVK